MYYAGHAASGSVSSFRARDYDPPTGRFLSRDPVNPDLRQPESVHLYAFANSNPHVSSDPTGQESLISINISLAIQTAIRSIPQFALREGFSFIKRQLVEAVFNASFGRVVKALLPPSAYKRLEELERRKAQGVGKVFESTTVADLVCPLLGREAAYVLSWLWFGPRVTDAGDPKTNGVNCNQYIQKERAGERGRHNQNPFPVPGEFGQLSDPDFVIKQTPPTDTVGSRAWVIGDIKISTDRAIHSYIDPAKQIKQFNTMTAYAKKHGRHVVVLITYKGKKSDELKLQQAFLKKHVFLVVFRVLGK